VGDSGIPPDSADRARQRLYIVPVDFGQISRASANPQWCVVVAFWGSKLTPLLAPRPSANTMGSAVGL
jgi:hypothetical protein